MVSHAATRPMRPVMTVAVTTDVEGETASNPTTAAEDAMTAEAVETTSVHKDTEGMDSGQVTGFVQSAAT